jgi:hypothetical protein
MLKARETASAYGCENEKKKKDSKEAKQESKEKQTTRGILKYMRMIEHVF